MSCTVFSLYAFNASSRNSTYAAMLLEYYSWQLKHPSARSHTCLEQTTSRRNSQSSFSYFLDAMEDWFPAVVFKWTRYLKLLFIPATSNMLVLQSSWPWSSVTLKRARKHAVYTSKPLGRPETLTSNLSLRSSIHPLVQFPIVGQHSTERRWPYGMQISDRIPCCTKSMKSK